MKGRALVFVGCAVVLSVVLASCGKKEETSTTSGANNPGGKPVDDTTTGTVTGTIQLDGTPSEMKAINMAAVPNCAKGHSSAAMTEEVAPGENGTSQNVVVYLKGDFSQYSFETAQSPVSTVQEGGTYIPHVLALRVGQPLRVTNSDRTTHTIHTIPMINRQQNDSQSPGAMPISLTFARQEIAIPVKCNVHPWMKAPLDRRVPWLKSVLIGAACIVAVPAGLWGLVAGNSQPVTDLLARTGEELDDIVGWGDAPQGGVSQLGYSLRR